MKAKRGLMMLAAILILGGSSVLTSCSEDSGEPTSATDPLPYPQEYINNKDLSVKPGDSFFDYCNGSWLVANPIPSDPTKNLGGLYAAGDKMNERIDQLKARVADIGKFYTLMDQIHSHAEASHTYIAAQKAKIQKPASKEEAYRTIGKMYRDGVNALRMSFTAIWDKTQLKAVLQPNEFDRPSEVVIARLQNQERKPLKLTRAAGESTIPALLAEGMGFDPSLIMIEDAEAKAWEKMWNTYTVDQLYQLMQDAWLEYEAYADEAGLAAYNATLPPSEQLTMENLLSSARTALGYTISYHLQQQFVPQSLKDKYLGVTKEIQAALRKRIEKVDWMSETTKQNAIDKMDHYTLNVAFPDQWHTDCIPALADCPPFLNRNPSGFGMAPNKCSPQDLLYREADCFGISFQCIYYYYP